jgi:ubiquinone/menaquinone biosynthesis C-methylase UbiE/uncharacterized protein YbaR (Trm112 family)
MNESALDIYRCPYCGGRLTIIELRSFTIEVESGTLECAGCRHTFPIRRNVPRFVEGDNYASNFGFQWNRFKRTQLDSHCGLDITRRRFLAESGWPADSLRGMRILDVGCGAGRFAEIALSLGGCVFAVDYSTAVDACRDNLEDQPELHIAQADIFALPFAPETFDRVYCFGVLQHTPNAAHAFAALTRMLKPGAQIAVDVYRKRWTGLFQPKYWLRPLTSRMDKKRLFRYVEQMVPLLLPVSRGVSRIPGAGSILRRLVPVANYEGIYPLNATQLEEWAVLDTFDWFSPTYDQPQTPAQVRRWLVEAGLDSVEVVHVMHLVGRGRRPAF